MKTGTCPIAQQNAFALMDARLILAKLGQRFSLSVAAGHQVAPERGFTLCPKYGLQMVVKVREPNAVQDNKVSPA